MAHRMCETSYDNSIHARISLPVIIINTFWRRLSGPSPKGPPGRDTSKINLREMPPSQTFFWEFTVRRWLLWGPCPRGRWGSSFGIGGCVMASWSKGDMSGYTRAFRLYAVCSHGDAATQNQICSRRPRCLMYSRFIVKEKKKRNRNNTTNQQPSASRRPLL